jgi:hypothetical protein
MYGNGRARAEEPQSRQSSLEGGVDPRAGRSPLEGGLDGATPLGRGGRHGVGRAVGVCLNERCVVFGFLQVLSRIPLVVLGDPQGCPRQKELLAKLLRQLVPIAFYFKGRKRVPCLCIAGK